MEETYYKTPPFSSNPNNPETLESPPNQTDFNTYSPSSEGHNCNYSSSRYLWSQPWEMDTLDNGPASSTTTTWTGWPTTTTSTSSNRLRHYDWGTASDDVDLEEKLAIVGAGFSNLGNTCFLNSILQCFIHTVPLFQELLDFEHQCWSERYCVFCALWELIDLSVTSTGRSVSPWKFVDYLSFFSSSFQRFQQEDAHEFLQCFLDRLESCCNRPKPMSSVSPEGHNFVKQVFGGRLVSKLKCCNCGHCSDTYEPSIDLSLEIEDADNLLSALDSFTKVEKIEDPDTQFTCESCKEKVSIEKQLLLDQAPTISAFHLKRFKNDGSIVEKIDKFVEFPLELDMLPYTSCSDANVEKLQYDLYAVVVHIGFSSTSGHYYCFVQLSPGAWYKFDDAQVVRVREDYVLSQEAYILFYARKGTPWFSEFIHTQNQFVERIISNTSPKSVLDSVDIYSSSSTVINNNGCEVKEASPSGDLLTQNYIGLGENKIENKKPKDDLVKADLVKTDLVKTDLHPSSSSTLLPCHADHVVAPSVLAPSVLKESNINRPFGIARGFADETAKILNVTPKARELPRSVSPDIYREDSPAYNIPRDHLKSAEKVTCKRQLNKELEDDLGRKQACSTIKKNSHGSRGAQLLAAVKRSYSEGSVNKKRSRMDAATNNGKHSSGSTGERILAGFR